MTPGKPLDEHENRNTGLNENSEPVFLVVGKLRKPHGIQGEMKMTVITNLPELLEEGNQAYVGARYRPLKIRSIRWHNADILISFEEYPGREEAGVLRNQLLFLPEEDFPPLPEGEYYHHQLIGLKVVTDDNRELGELVEILETGANDVYLVRDPAGQEVLIPATEEVIQDIQFDQQKVIVTLLPGLLD